MTPIDWAFLPLRRYADFRGRTPRAEYWWYTLAVTIVLAIAKAIELEFEIPPLLRFYGPISALVLAATIVASVAAQIRRLHDTNRSGWWLLGLYLPQIATIIAAGKPGEEANRGQAAIIVGGVMTLVMAVTGIIMLVFFVQKGTDGPNRYGADPYGPENLEEVFA